ncbi:unnamed protein product [Miscanthus lutarioriparius]|uniref:Uncharacterized protein n=1 Tax=Miscanthus lutarioriparius TaxID=422564 RepID=A0A811Q4T7_9POAL|nr:unnamed protein product [Miscanthus lutarioriparius]
MAATLEELVGLVEPSPQSPSVFLHLPPTPHHDNGVPSSGQQQQQEDVALEQISRLLMEEEEDMHGMFLRNDDPALLHAQQSLAQIIASSSSSTSNGASDLYKDGNNSTVSNMCATATGAEPCSVMDLLNMAFVKGREEGCKFLPKDNKRLVMKDITRNGRLEADAETTGRACKLMATMARPEEEAEVQELIGRMMLDDCEVPTEEMERLRAAMADEAAMSNSREARRRQQQQVDMRTLLVSCAQAVDERHGARELLEQAKQHASPTGDATQRLAHCFVEALEARLAGTGSVLHRSLPALDTTTLLQGPEFLRAFRLFNATCCFQRVGFAFANMTICRAAAGSSRLHVVDYGLHLGLQWPGLLRRLAARDGGPPEMTITFIDHPLPGFRPARHIEETGHMLSDCARELGVPFKFHAVAAARWDAVRVEVDPDPGAVVVVNSLFKLETLADDSLVVDRASPRDSVLAGIRRMRPAVFTHGVVNGLCGNSFLTRFREALFYFSAAFDMLDATLPRNSEQRMVLERDFLRACVVNVVACEGRDRTDRFDTYRQWQQRSRRAGLRQLPLDPAVVGAVRVMVKKQCYHREFVMDENDGWLLQGWKGRILYAHSTWVADES